MVLLSLLDYIKLGEDEMKTFECIVHNFKGSNIQYINEYYKVVNGKRYLSDAEEYSASKKEDRAVFELIHNKDYKKVVSPYNGVMLYGRFINISSRMKDEKARF